jgi:hypothetical protein
LILETVLGGALGGLARLAPEVLRLLDRKNERKHELALLDKNTAAEQARAAAGIKEREQSADAAQVLAGLDALKSAIASQGQLTGVKWIDGINQTVRPFLTYGIVAPYAFGKSLVFAALCWAGFAKLGLDATVVREAITATYTAADMAIVAGVLNFWFLGRVFDKRS